MIQGFGKKQPYSTFRQAAVPPTLRMTERGLPEERLSQKKEKGTVRKWKEGRKEGKKGTKLIYRFYSDFRLRH